MEEPLQAYPITTTLFIFISLITSSLAHTKNLISCLTSNHVNNFTLQSQPSYYSFLNISIQNLWFSQSGYPKPIAIVLPETKEHLGSVISCCGQHGPFVIRRSGGHSYEGLSSIADETPFVIIDMMNLNRVDIDMDSLTAWVEAGATLGETYHAIAMCSTLHGFSAGSCLTGGIGGHISGGGFGLLSRKHGLAADNLVDAVLVNSNGQFLDCKLMGEDVFWTIRGGGGGVWGAVYAWKIKLLPVLEIVTGFIVSRPGVRSQVANLVLKWQLVAPQLEDEFYLSVFVGANLPKTKTIGISATFKGLYLGPKTSMLSILDRVFPESGCSRENAKRCPGWNLFSTSPALKMAAQLMH
ncbi:FAD linked oxidase [Cinnamomum micranthum f. kanehirae]|uniref:FAD linked oxidase n=1 Tax=Cinnamomum micranthum f. kanehirae TaxID=337451 RepID=A0A443PAD2_9MAGN|nr:FAD linked oxidase [Cinnamomum micranthum f. kanehirae]